MATAAAPPPFADEVLVILQRAHPAEVEKEELLDQCGSSVDELREALDFLKEQGELDPEADEYRWLDPDATAKPPPAAAPEAEADEAEKESSVAGPALDAHARTHLAVVATFGHGPRDSDDAAARKSQAIAEEVGNALAVALPKIGFHVEVVRVEAFDSPRVIYPPPEEE